MQRKIFGVYTLYVIVFIILTVFIVKNYKVSVESTRKDSEAGIVSFEEVYETTEDRDGSSKSMMHYTFTAPESEYGRTDIVFYTLHQSVSVYIDGENVYNYGVGDDYVIGDTPGRVWNSLILTAADTGKKVEIEITSPYESNIYTEPVVYIGEKTKIYSDILRENTYTNILNAIILLVGIVFSFVWIIRRKYLRYDRRILYLGLFALFTAIWIFTDSSVSVLITKNAPVTTYVTYFSLMLIPVPFLLYIQASRMLRIKKIIMLNCILSFVIMAVSIVLLLSGVMDLKQSLIFMHIYFVVLVVIATWMLISSLKSKKATSNTKLNIACVALCIISCAFDVIKYYQYNGTSQMTVGLTMFFIYTVILGIQSLKEIQNLIDKGKLVNMYKDMAYHDILTGMFNRTAFENDMKELASADGYAVVMFDLNDLKKCNDSYGHDDGDSYIIKSAEIISEIYGLHGKCYRIGGDEFCAVLDNVKKEECDKLAEMLELATDNATPVNENLEINIACGYAVFDSSVDKDLNDTRKRADAIMYSAKNKMKNESGDYKEGLQ